MAPRPPVGPFQVIDAHAGGEPLRIVVSGLPPVEGDTMLARRRFAERHLDDVRRFLMWEPRGHADMYGCWLLPPATPDGDAGVLFLHNDGFSTMCGHGVIALVTAGLEQGLMSPRDAAQRSRDGEGTATQTVRLDTPAGRVTATARLVGDRVVSVSFLNVASFLHAADVPLDVEGWGEVRADIAFGGAYYAYVDADALSLPLEPTHYGAIIDGGRRIKQAAGAQVRLAHPSGDGDLDFIYGTIFVSKREGWPRRSRNVCVFADGEVDRSPTGTGVSGRLAIHFAKGEIGLDDVIEVESLVGSRFGGRVVERVGLGPLEAIVPEVTGRAHVVGRAELWADPDDALAAGFLLR
jgi:trans-L-3-hydroxyproline dehydratase